MLRFGMAVRRSTILWTLALWLLAAAAGARRNALADVKKGESLVSALETLRAQGLQLIFSSALIGADLAVDVEPGAGSPEEIARRILAPHGLTLDPIRPGLFAVVKAGTSAPSIDAGVQEVAKPAANPEALYEVDVYASRYEIEQETPSSPLVQLTREDIEAFQA